MAHPVVRYIHQIPAIKRAKAFRHRIFSGFFLSRDRKRGRDFAGKIGGDRVYAFAIAFNTPWAIDALTRSWAINGTGSRLIVVDNSRDRNSRAEIARICRLRDTPYFALPSNPENHANRNHGLAMSWTFHNIVRHLRPEIFGYIDHDNFPIREVDVAARMHGKLAYGHRRSAAGGRPGWYLWAGLCFMRFSAVEHIDLDFAPAFDEGMDTGGANWRRFYSTLAADNVEVERGMPSSFRVDRLKALADTGATFFHVGGASYDRLLTKDEVRRRVRDHVWQNYLGGVEHRMDGTE